LQFNWLTHAVAFVLVDIRWGAAGFFQYLFAPATIYINFPLGAVVYWIVRRRRPLPRSAAGLSTVQDVSVPL
jgi:hypothetical protein